MARKKVSVTKQTKSGRNTQFKDNYSGQTMNKQQFVSKIKSGEYDNYHVRKINGIETPVSNPDKSKNNNLD
ncbi:MAG: hypothetical protein BHK79_02790 [Halanaerobium sp. MDAL1]|nr:MAG: hypothetical protein BHK79_02790 [Halanaerobium sp. MDAL1]